MKSFFSILCLLTLVLASPYKSAQGSDFSELKSALSPYLGDSRRPYYELGTSELTAQGKVIPFQFKKADGSYYSASAEYAAGTLSGITDAVTSPAIPVKFELSLANSLASLIEGRLTITGVALDTQSQSKSRYLVAFEERYDEEHAPDRYLALVNLSSGGGKAKFFKPQTQDLALLKKLALSMARFQAYELASRYDANTQAARDRGEEFAGPVGPMARLEVELRLALSRTSDLVIQTPEESAIGFDPNSQLVQYMLPSVLSDNAVFVTFTFDGSYGLEDFN